MSTGLAATGPAPDTVSRGGIAYRLYGETAAPAMLMVQGAAMQLIDWSQRLVDALAARYRLILFDHRGIGASAAEFADFTLFDLAADAVGLLDELDITSAHVVGYSMGGMVAQIMAARHPARVRSLVTLMSNAGEAPRTASPAAMRLLRRYGNRAPDTETAVDWEVEAAAHFAGRHFEEGPARDAAWARARRAYRPETVARQLRAIEADGPRHRLAEAVIAPWLILHGERDDLIPPADARAITALNPAARYVEIPGVAHEIPQAAAGDIACLILEHCNAT